MPKLLKSRSEQDLEHAMFLQDPYKLKTQDVFMTLNNHVKKYTKFVYTTWEVISGLFGSCLLRFRSRRRQKLMILFHQGKSKIERYTDVRTIVKSLHKLDLLTDLFLRKQGRQLARL